MRILSVLNPVLNDYNISGPAIFAVNIAKSMISSGNTVDFVASETIHDLLGEDTTSKVFTPKIDKISSIRSAVEYAIDRFRSGNYDIMHINIHQLSVLDSILNIVPDWIPVVYTQHTSTILGRFSLSYRDSATSLSTCNNRKIKIVCPSETMKRIWSEYCGTEDLPNVEVIRNGINKIDSIPYVNPSERKGYVCCARIDPNKGVLEVAKFCNEYNIPITIIGDLHLGTLKASNANYKYFSDFEEVVSNSDCITWIKYLPNEEVRKIMSKSKGIINFSHKESSSLISMEALSVGTPVFYLEEDATSELITDTYNGLKIGRNEVYRKRFDSRLKIFKQKFDKFNEIAENSTLYTNSLNSFDELELSIEDCAKNYLDLFKKVI